MPEVVLNTTISQLEIALEGKIDFIKKTNPFGSGEKEEDKYWADGGGVADPEVAMQQILNVVKTRQTEIMKSKPKPNISGGRRRRNE